MYTSRNKHHRTNLLLKKTEYGKPVESRCEESEIFDMKSKRIIIVIEFEETHSHSVVKKVKCVQFISG